MLSKKSIYHINKIINESIANIAIAINKDEADAVYSWNSTPSSRRLDTITQAVIITVTLVNVKCHPRRDNIIQEESKKATSAIFQSLIFRDSQSSSLSRQAVNTIYAIKLLSSLHRQVTSNRYSSLSSLKAGIYYLSSRSELLSPQVKSSSIKFLKPVPISSISSLSQSSSLSSRDDLLKLTR